MFGSCLFCSCRSKNQEKEGVISAYTLRKKMADSPKLKIINVLDSASFQKCRIQGSLNIPLAQLQSQVASWDRASEVVLYCAGFSCPMSGTAYTIMRSMGFKAVWAYEGGINEWIELGYPTEGPCA
jgi:adenylyltransferase/sulfurtransferase